ncbi:acyl-CoA thioesterase [Natronobiforma cellulositropha]|uniref:acyl-CoA thioesterase n=1 Tax=Natronobiforma cellulositropha TaxID=1679076 RepID=UPI0021D59742|nr:thioesterase family protein [Natronobiforma cellulositropha]
METDRYSGRPRNDGDVNEHHEYPYVVTIDVRLRDIDFMGHVNNAVYATYLEQARAAFFREVIGESLVEADTVLANLTIDYEQPIDAADTVTVGLRVAPLGSSSLPMEYEVYAGDRRAATARTVQVVVDRERGRSRSIPEHWRERIATHRERHDA